MRGTTATASGDQTPITLAELDRSPHPSLDTACPEFEKRGTAGRGKSSVRRGSRSSNTSTSEQPGCNAKLDKLPRGHGIIHLAQEVVRSAREVRKPLSKAAKLLRRSAPTLFGAVLFRFLVEGSEESVPIR